MKSVCGPRSRSGIVTLIFVDMEMQNKDYVSFWLVNKMVILKLNMRVGVGPASRAEALARCARELSPRLCLSCAPTNGDMSTACLLLSTMNEAKPVDL